MLICIFIPVNMCVYILYIYRCAYMSTYLYMLFSLSMRWASPESKRRGWYSILAPDTDTWWFHPRNLGQDMVQRGFSCNFSDLSQQNMDSVRFVYIHWNGSWMFILCWVEINQRISVIWHVQYSCPDFFSQSVYDMIYIYTCI